MFCHSLNFYRYTILAGIEQVLFAIRMISLDEPAIAPVYLERSFN